MNYNNSAKLRLPLLLLIVMLSISFLAACRGGDGPSGPTGSYTIHTPAPGGATPSGQELSYTDISVLSVGDIMYHQTQLNSAYDAATGAYDFSENFQYVKSIVSAADLAVANFETTLSNQDKYSAFPQFNSPLSVLDSIKDAGFDLLLYANNHCYDFKKPGLLATLGHLREYGFEYIGAKADPSAKSYLLKEVKGVKLGLLNYTDTITASSGDYYTINGITVNDGGEAYIDLYERGREEALYAEVTQRIAELKANGAELILLYIHWGDEYKLEPISGQKTIAQKLCDLGVDVILGSHPHVVEPMEILTSQTDPSHSTVCFYSLGNYISNQNRLSFQDLSQAVRPYTENGLMVTLNIRKYSTGDVYVRSIDYTPTWVHRYASSAGGYHYNVVPLPQANRDPAAYALTDSSFGVDHAAAALQMTDPLFSGTVTAFNTKMADEIAAFSQAYRDNSK